MPATSPAQDSGAEGWVEQHRYMGRDTAYRVRLSDVATHQQITVLPGHSGAIYSVGFSPDGKTLASGADGTVLLWNVSYLVDFVARLCASVGRSLTPAEWARYIPLTAYLQVCR